MYRSPKFLRKLFPQRIWGIPVSDKSIFLTFDDGPDPEITPWLLDFLKANGINATFFCVGENVARYPEIYQRIINEGHKTGNHTMHHLNGIKTEKTTYLESIKDASRLIDSNLFRPPYGRMRKSLDKIVSKDFKTIMWTWLSKDYDNKIKVENYSVSKENPSRRHFSIPR